MKKILFAMLLSLFGFINLAAMDIEAMSNYELFGEDGRIELPTELPDEDEGMKELNTPTGQYLAFRLLKYKCQEYAQDKEKLEKIMLRLYQIQDDANRSGNQTLVHIIATFLGK